MPKYKIYWNIGFGLMGEVIEADNKQEAIKAAYEAAREDFENSAEYGARPLRDGECDDE